jgi:hypothetical protein
MKTHHTANLVLFLVLITAIAAMYYIFKGPGMAIQAPVETDVLGECCCINHGGIPFMKPSMKTLSMTFQSDCMATCQEYGAVTC